MKQILVNIYSKIKKDQPKNWFDLIFVIFGLPLVWMLVFMYIIVFYSGFKINTFVFEQLAAAFLFFVGWILIPLLKAIHDRKIESRTIAEMVYMSLGLYTTLLPNLILYSIWFSFILFFGSYSFEKLMKTRFGTKLNNLFSLIFPNL